LPEDMESSRISALADRMKMSSESR